MLYSTSGVPQALDWRSAEPPDQPEMKILKSGCEQQLHSALSFLSH